MTIRFKLGIPAAMLALLLAGCGNGNGSENADRLHTPPTASPKVQIQSTDGANAPAGQAGQSVIRDKSQTLAGGSEKNNRVIKPLDNYKLQREHPNVLVLKGSDKSNRIALTFDDGPDARFTPQVLDILKKHSVKATFFVMGSRVAGHPDVAKRIFQEGHDVGNHTYWHPKLFRENSDRVRWELTQTDAEIEKVFGYSPKMVRPPYGGLTEPLLDQLERMNYSVIGWSVDSLDWKQLNSDACQANVMSQVKPGAILLFHSGGDWSQDLSGMVGALDVLIPRLKQEGFEFVTVSKLLGISKKK